MKEPLVPLKAIFMALEVFIFYSRPPEFDRGPNGHFSYIKGLRDTCNRPSESNLRINANEISFTSADSRSIVLRLFSFIDGYASVIEIDGSSDKAGCAAARTVICTRVMQTHRASKTGSGDTIFDVPSS